jgi:hypothetical protein
MKMKNRFTGANALRGTTLPGIIPIHFFEYFDFNLKMKKPHA